MFRHFFVCLDNAVFTKIPIQQANLMRLPTRERDLEVGRIAFDILTALKHLESHGFEGLLFGTKMIS